MRHLLALFPIGRDAADKAAAVIAATPRGTIVAYFAFAAIIAADAIVAVLVLDGRL